MKSCEKQEVTCKTYSTALLCNLLHSHNEPSDKIIPPFPRSQKFCIYEVTSVLPFRFIYIGIRISKNGIELFNNAVPTKFIQF